MILLAMLSLHCFEIAVMKVSNSSLLDDSIRTTWSLNAAI